MKNIELIINFAKDNNGTITSQQANKNGFSRGNIMYLVEKGVLEHVSRGVYILPEFWEDEFLNLQTRYKKGIFSNATALFLHGYTDRTPHKFHMTFPLNYNVSSVKQENVIVFCNPFL